MKKLFALICVLLTLCGCEYTADSDKGKDKLLIFKYYNTTESASSTFSDSMKGVWISQFDMSAVYTDGAYQRDVDDYIRLVDIMISNLKEDGFNTCFLQVRPNGDSIYPSTFCPASKYATGAYGREFKYDPLEIFIEKAHEKGLSVHAWINPYRLMTREEIACVSDNYLIKQWYISGDSAVFEYESRLYLNPADERARKLIIDGAAEICMKYDIDGIHMDDYFYPTQEEGFDNDYFTASGFTETGDFRSNAIDMTVSGLYEMIKSVDSSIVYGVAPAGNIYSLYKGYYIDIEKWCSEDGFIDYIMPQLYFGFENKTCPFDKVLTDWTDIMSNEKIKLYIGLSAAKPVLAAGGWTDPYGGTEKGKTEWSDRNDILGRCIAEMNKHETVKGFCLFSYQYIYDVKDGTYLEAFAEEWKGIKPYLQ